MVLSSHRDEKEASSNRRTTWLVSPTPSEASAATLSAGSGGVKAMALSPAGVEIGGGIDKVS